MGAWIAVTGDLGDFTPAFVSTWAMFLNKTDFNEGKYSRAIFVDMEGTKYYNLAYYS